LGVPRKVPDQIDTTLALRANGRLIVGRERIALLEAVAKYGSITKAAEVAGFSYKTAWDSVNAINNLLPRPAFLTRTGGQAGGGAEVTEEGRRLISAFRSLEEKLGRISTAIAEDGFDNPHDLLFWGMGLKLSIRNAFHCKVADIKPAPVNVEVKLDVSPGIVFTANITNASLRDLALAPGRSVVALINAASVMLASPDAQTRISARNKILGRVIEITGGGVDCEVTLDLGLGKTITAVITNESVAEMAMSPGMELCAIFKTSNVILASD